MALSTSSEKKGMGYGKGIFIDKVRIISAEDVSGTKIFEKIGKNYVPDLAVRITFDIGKSFTPEDTVFGNFTRNDDNSVKGWGGAFKVRDLFVECDITGDLTSDNRLPEEWVKGLIGKELWRLQYVTKRKPDGKFKYYSWNTYLNANDDPSLLSEKFMDSVTSGYPKDYHPEIMDEDDSFQPDKFTTVDEDDPFK